MQIKVGEKTNCDLVCKYDDDGHHKQRTFKQSKSDGRLTNFNQTFLTKNLNLNL